MDINFIYFNQEGVMKSLLIELMNYFFELLYPRNLTCVLCHNEVEDNELCDVCLGSIQFNIGKVCESCGRMILSGQYPICDNCKTLDRYYDKGISVAIYDEYIKKLIFNFKYHDKRYIAHTMASFMLKKVIELELEIDFDYIVPVPLHKERFNSRGFNQAELIARFMCELSGLKLNRNLKRIKATPALNNLSLEERHVALTEAFALSGEIRGNIIIVDDIFTTGTTMNSCCKVLKGNGSDYILIVSFAVGR